MARLGDIATVRSKNAGPFEITFDIMFPDELGYQNVKATGVISPALFARLYGVSENECLYAEYDNGWAIKCTILRPLPSGAVGDCDTYGSVKAFPLQNVEIPIDP